MLAFILCGGNIALRFVKYNIYVFVFTYFIAVEKNFIAFGYFMVRKLYNCAVYCYFTVRNGCFYVFA